MSVVGRSNAASVGAENFNTIESVQAITNIVRPLLSLSSVGFALAGKSALGALAAGVVAAGDGRLTTWSQRCVEGFKAALGFAPFVGSLVTLADGAYGMVNHERLVSHAQVNTDEAQSSLLWGGIGLVLDGVVRLKGKTIKDALHRVVDEVGVPIPGGFTVSIVSGDGLSALQKHENNFRNALKNAGFSMGFAVDKKTCFAQMDYHDLHRLVMRLDQIECELRDSTLFGSSFHNLVLSFYSLARSALSTRRIPVYAKIEECIFSLVA